MDIAKRKILLVLNFKVIDIYRKLIESLLNNFNITIILLDYYQTSEEVNKKCIFNNQKIEFYFYKNLFISIEPIKFKKNNSFLNYCTQYSTTLKYKYSYNLANQYLENNNIELILHTQDTSLNNIGLLKAAYDLNIPTIIPSAIMMEPDDYFRKGKLQYMLHENNTFYEKYIFNKVYSKFTKLNNIFYYTAPVLNFLKNYNLLSSNPWLYGGALYTRYLSVSNLYHKNISIENGIDQEKIKLIGDINYDQLYINYKKTINKTNTIILAVPQFFEHNYCTFAEAKKRIEYLVEISSSINNFNLILSLHPSMKYDNYQYLENKYSCKISKKPLFEILPSAKLFICTQSNTIIWSTLCHINTIVVDFYDWDYTTTKLLTSCILIKEKRLFNTTLINDTINKTLDFTHDDKLLSRDLVFTGNVIDNYISLISNTIKNNNRIKKRKYFIPLTSLYFKYKYFVKKYKLAKLKKILNQYDNFYIAPYNDMTQELNDLLNNSKFNGYIDNYKNNQYTKDINDINFDKSCIIIVSPNYSDEIYDIFKTKTKNLYVFNLL